MEQLFCNVKYRLTSRDNSLSDTTRRSKPVSRPETGIFHGPTIDMPLVKSFVFLIQPTFSLISAPTFTLGAATKRQILDYKYTSSDYRCLGYRC